MSRFFEKKSKYYLPFCKEKPKVSLELCAKAADNERAWWRVRWSRRSDLERLGTHPPDPGPPGGPRLEGGQVARQVHHLPGGQVTR